VVLCSRAEPDFLCPILDLFNFVFFVYVFFVVFCFVAWISFFFLLLDFFFQRSLPYLEFNGVFWKSYILHERAGVGFVVCLVGYIMTQKICSEFLFY